MLEQGEVGIGGHSGGGNCLLLTKWSAKPHLKGASHVLLDKEHSRQREQQRPNPEA